MGVKLPLTREEVAERNLIMVTDGLFDDLLRNLRRIKTFSPSCFADLNSDITIIEEIHLDYLKRIVEPLTE